MRIPESFSVALEASFAGRLRARWSDHERAVLIETRGPRGKARPPKVFPDPHQTHLDRLRFEDDAARARDGFQRLLAVAPGTRMRCIQPGCLGELVLPPFKTVAPKCGVCGHTHKPVGYWPLSESLLEHLRWSDPLRGGIDRVFDATDAAEAAREKGQKRSLRNHGEAVLKEDFGRLFQIQQVGYTGKEFRG